MTVAWTGRPTISFARALDVSLQAFKNTTPTSSRIMMWECSTTEIDLLCVIVQRWVQSSLDQSHHWNYEAHPTNNENPLRHSLPWIRLICYRWWICMFQELLLLKRNQYWRHWKSSFEQNCFLLWRVSLIRVWSTRLDLVCFSPVSL